MSDTEGVAAMLLSNKWRRKGGAALKTKNEVIIKVTNIFKTEDTEDRKNEFNKRYESYINFCESKI